jgi:hypothetical protein
VFSTRDRINVFAHGNGREHGIFCSWYAHLAEAKDMVEMHRIYPGGALQYGYRQRFGAARGANPGF